ncbi:hypothetical protein DSO57_1025467 [Entomophthora muscae]|uniref:Uncharacterized protein n=1 Tax=Entomophthora muscae TaxID=34485 RepID=A0ACC2UN81_9FUNG|nr:hypothetical protein DSO57_1025467 [Entomophthora muscae]
MTSINLPWLWIGLVAMKVYGFVGKLLLLAGCSALKDCGYGLSTNLENLDVNCEKWNGTINIGPYYKVDPSKEFLLKEVTGDLVVDNEVPSNLKWPLKVSRLVLNSNARSQRNDFSQIKAEEIRIFGFQAEELIIAEPSVLGWYYGSIKAITGITGTRLKRVVLGNDVRNRVQFDNVTRLDSLVFHRRLYPTFPRLTLVNEVYAQDLIENLNMGIQSVGKLHVTTYGSGDRSILLNDLKTADEVTIASHKVKLFSAPNLTWGRLEIKHATELILNENLGWKGLSSITSDDFCEKYFNAFTARGLAFETDNSCKADCTQLYTPMNLTSYAFCDGFTTIVINQKSAEYIRLNEATTITGDLIITNYNGTFSAPKLTEITGNVKITNSKPFSFSALNLKKIQGSVTIQNSSSVSLPRLNQFHGQITIQSSGSFSVPNLQKIKGDITIQNSSSFSALNLDEVEGSINIQGSSNLSADILKHFQGSILLHGSSSFSAPTLEKIQGDITILDSSSFSAPELKEIQGNVTIQNSSSFSVENLDKFKGSITIKDSSPLLTPNLKIIQGNITINNSSLSASGLEEVWGSFSIQNSIDFSFPNLKKIKGNLDVKNSNPSSRQALYHLESVRSIEFHQQIDNIEFRSLTAINTLIIRNSSLARITGIDATQLEELTIASCPRLNHLPLWELKAVNNAYISAAGVEDISNIFSASFHVTSQITIASFQHRQMNLHLLSAGQLTLKDNPNLEVVHLKAEHLNLPIKTINNPNFRVANFINMRINYNLQPSNFKVLTSSTEKELQSQGSLNTAIKM